MATRLQEIGQSTVAITDHGGTLGAVLLYKELKEVGIKMIYGVEAYTCDDATVKDKDNKYYHLVLLAKNETGRVNLNRLITISEKKENKYNKPRIDMGILSEYKDGLIVLSACLAGEVSKRLLDNDYDGAKAVVAKYKNVFGSDYYLEIQAHDDPIQIDINKKILDTARETNTEVVVTSDAHYVVPDDKEYQNLYAFNGKYKESEEGSYVDCYVQSEDEVRGKISYLDKDTIDRLIENTDSIASMCNVTIPLSAPIMPEVPIPEKYSDNLEYIIDLCNEGFDKILDFKNLEPEKAVVYAGTYKMELDALKRMGFIDYILFVESYANYREERGPARGSGAGSLICYLTGITQIDPVKYGLMFERFVDVGQLQALEAGEIDRSELKVPDIDLDFATYVLKDVLRFIYGRYGEGRVASIGSYGKNLTKGTIRDMCKVLDIDLKEADKIAKSFDEYEISDIDMMISGLIPTPVSAREAIAYTKRYPKLFKFVRKLTGLPKSFGLHPCGKVVTIGDTDNYLPSRYDKEGVRYLQGDMHEVEDLGIVKADVLSLKTLNQKFETHRLCGESDDFLSTRQEMDDDKVMSLFRKGDTVGIFQFSSMGMRQTLKKMQVKNLHDLAVANALFRPGPIRYIDEYCARKDGTSEFSYIHPDLEPVLAPTYGIIVYQEQLIQIGRVAGLHNPDLLRKATAKKIPKLMTKVKPELIGGLAKRGWTVEQVEKLWEDIIEFSAYSFGRAHAYAYSMLAYLTAKQKAYYPLEFYVGLLNSYIGEGEYLKNNAEEIVADIARHNINILPFDYRQDHRRCSIKDKSILYGIPLIRECSQIVANQVYYASGMQFTHFWQLLKHLYDNGINTAQMVILIRLGFFKAFGNEAALSRINALYIEFGNAKRISKEKANDSPVWQIILKNTNSTGKNGKVLQKLSVVDSDCLMNDLESLCLNDEYIGTSYKEIIDYQKEVLGFVSLYSGDEKDRPILYVRGVYPVKRKRDGVVFGQSVVAQSLGSGKTTRYTVFNEFFNKDPIEEGDVIRCVKWTPDGVYFNMEKYIRLV